MLYLPALVMIISVVDLWNFAQRSLLWRMTLTPFLATDSPVFLYVVTRHPLSGTDLTDTTSPREREERERGRGGERRERGGEREREREGESSVR